MNNDEDNFNSPPMTGLNSIIGSVDRIPQSLLKKPLLSHIESKSSRYHN